MSAASTAGPPAPFASRRVAGRVLVTNDWGHHARLDDADFLRFGRGELAPAGALFEELASKGFLARYMDLERLSARWREAHSYLWSAASLHIVVLTRRCNMRCAYCHASAGSAGSGMMTPATARTVVERVMETPARCVTVEFQGGEPLLNRGVLELVCDEAAAAAERAGKELRLSLVSNLSLMDEDTLASLARRRVSLCTSLDGPAGLHDSQRRLAGASSHARVERWWRAAREAGLTVEGLPTVTRASLTRAPDIVAEYRRMGARGVHLRFLNPIGHAARSWKRIGYEPEEFLAFYRSGLEAAIAAHRAGPPFFELIARVFLSKILAGRDLNYMDLRSPCGAGIGQTAWDWDGSVYPCDEARLLAAQGDAGFRLGHASRLGPKGVARHPVTRALVQASLLESQAGCSTCAYKPYCGVCPVLEFAGQGDLFGRAHRSFRCRIYRGIQDILFEKLDDPADRAVLEEWAAPTRSPGASPGRPEGPPPDPLYRRN